MAGKGMVVEDFCGLSRRKRPRIRKKLWGRKPQALGKTCAHSAKWLWFIYLGKAHSSIPYWESSTPWVLSTELQEAQELAGVARLKLGSSPSWGWLNSSFPIPHLPLHSLCQRQWRTKHCEWEVKELLHPASWAPIHPSAFPVPLDGAARGSPVPGASPLWRWRADPTGPHQSLFAHFKRLWAQYRAMQHLGVVWQLPPAVMGWQWIWTFISRPSLSPGWIGS